MNCCFENTLHYSSHGHGDWGVVRIGMLLPESVQLFVCPSACGRHGAIGAMHQGLKDRLRRRDQNTSPHTGLNHPTPAKGRIL